MSLQIAETRFITKASSGLAAIDVYGTTPTKIAANAGSIKSGLGAAFKTPNTSGQINKIVDGLTDALTKTGGKSFEDQLKAVKAVIGNKEALIANFKNGLVTDVLTNVGFGANAKEIAGVLVGDRDPTSLLTALGKTTPEMALVVNGIKTVMSADKLDTAQGISALLNKLSGNSELVKVFDLQPETLLLKTLLDDATKLRVPELVDAILETAADDKQRRALLIASTPKAVLHSDLDTVVKTMEFIGDVNTHRTYPDIIADILASYKAPAARALQTVENPDESSGIIAIDKEQLMSVLERLKPQWWLTTRDDVQVYNLDIFYNVSPDAVEALSQVPELTVPISMAGLYPIGYVQDINAHVRPWSFI